MKGTQDGWYIITQRRYCFDQGNAPWEWCLSRWGKPRGRDKDGIWNRTWEGFSFKNQSDYVEFMLRWG